MKENGEHIKTERLKSEVRKQECDRGMHQQATPFSPSQQPTLARLRRFEDKPFWPILSKWVIFMAGFPCEIAYIEEWFLSWT